MKIGYCLAEKKFPLVESWGGKILTWSSWSSFKLPPPFTSTTYIVFFSINHALHVAWSPTDKGVLQARRRLSLLRTNNYTYIVLLEVKILCPYSEPRSCYIGDKHTEKQTHIRQANLSPTQTPNMVDLNTWPQRNSPFEDGITP